MKHGIYDLLVTKTIEDSLARLPAGLTHRESLLATNEVALALAEAAARQLSGILGSRSAEVGDDNAIVKSAILINDLIALARERLNCGSSTEEQILLPPRKLLAIEHRGYITPRPETGVEAPWLFTAGKGSPSLLEELRKELSSSDGVDILVSFITVSGLRKIYDLLEKLTAADATGVPAARVRVLTTTYTGATDAEAIDRLALLPGVTAKVSFDGRRTRLHAKAWIFHRESGFGCAYAGSANLSGAALLGGLEWTVKFTERGQAELFERANAHFESLWNDPEFVEYDPSSESQRNALRAALHAEKYGDSGGQFGSEEPLAYFDLTPKTYQAEMLEDLAAERLRGRMRNLVVAATGTGKTMVAAFDYRRTCHELGGRPRVLFVAHRLEILSQSLRTFREVLRDHSFGEILAEGNAPSSRDHLFATIQSVTSRRLVEGMGAGYWHTVVIDECHRLAADSFDAFARNIKPKILLGLTATPERSDGQPIFSYFDNRPDGSPAVELRLWTALDLQLLAPFEYYGCDDETDFSDVPWDRAGEAQALDKLLTGNHVRARLVIDEWKRLSGNPRNSKALVFCVSVAHALFMAEAFTRAGLPSQCLIGNTDADTRRKAPIRLANGELSAIVTCDLFNEGIDIPSVDTILLLRPTQSPVLFQQQIGRGLRLNPGKESCLVLDFVGRFRSNFRIDILYRALTGLSRIELEEAVDKGFGKLPAGCHFHLDSQPRERILANLRAVANQTWPRLKSEIQAYAAAKGRANLTLRNFITDQKLELGDIYRDSGHSGWTTLLQEASLLETEAEGEDAYFSRRFASLLHVDDSLRIGSIQQAAEAGASYQATSPGDDLLMQMLAYQVDGGKEHIGPWKLFATRLDARKEMKSELAQLAGILAEKVRLPPERIPGIEDTPLVFHASYSSREILTALGWHTPTKKTPFQAGVLGLPDRKCELLFVTLDKREGYHSGIAYKDYAISPSLFHWQSQNSAGSDTPAGKRYIESKANGWQFQLFIRESRDDPYKACGPGVLESCKGDRPMSIVWRLSLPLSPSLYSRFSILRDA